MESTRQLKFKHIRIKTQFFINKFHFGGSLLVCISLSRGKSLMSIPYMALPHFSFTLWAGTARAGLCPWSPHYTLCAGNFSYNFLIGSPKKTEF